MSTILAMALAAASPQQAPEWPCVQSRQGDLVCVDPDEIPLECAREFGPRVFEEGAICIVTRSPELTNVALEFQRADGSLEGTYVSIDRSGRLMPAKSFYIPPATPNEPVSPLLRTTLLLEPGTEARPPADLRP